MWPVADLLQNRCRWIVSLSLQRRVDPVTADGQHHPVMEQIIEACDTAPYSDHSYDGSDAYTYKPA